MLHDEQIKNEDETKSWHKAYQKLTGTVDLALRKFWEIYKASEIYTNGIGGDYHVSPLMMMMDFAEAIDGVGILVHAGSAKNCPQQLRTALEIGFGLRYMLERDDAYEQRSLSYEYFHVLDGLKWAQRCDPEHPVGAELRRDLAGNPLVSVFDMGDKGVDIKKEIAKHEKKLNSSRYAAVKLEYDRMTAEKKKPKNWHSLWDGPKDVREIAKRLNLLIQYESLYRQWSGTTHGANAINRVTGRTDSGIQLDPIRSPVGLPGQCLQACQLTNFLIVFLIEKWVPQLREDYRTWYRDHMKPAFNYMTSVVIRG